MLVGLLLPQRCLVCGEAGPQLCADCRDVLPRLQPPFCERCGAPAGRPVVRCRECSGRRLSFAQARAAVAYDDSVRRLVAGWKERGLRRLADDAAGLVAELLPAPDAAQVTFVPADPARLASAATIRPERLAHALATRWDLPCRSILRRSARSQRQRGLTLAERRRNVAGVFAVARSVRHRPAHRRRLHERGDRLRCSLCAAHGGRRAG